MEFQVPDRVHLVPVGYEQDRAIDSVEHLKADQVVLIEHSDNNRQGKSHFEIVSNRLNELGYEVTKDNCDFFDLYESLAVFNQLIDEHRGQEIYINIATGSKITAIAGMISANINDVTAYYAKARVYSDDHIPREVEEIIELPRYRINSPDTDHVMILKFLNDNRDMDISKKDLIEFAEMNNISYFIDNKESTKAKYRTLDNNIIEPLLSDEYISIEKKGRTQVVGITNTGIRLLRAFGHVILKNDEVEELENSKITF